jgi:hypothetical protein
MEYLNGLILNRPIMHESKGYPKWIDTRGVKQIYKERFKTANPLYINYAHTFRTASLRRLSSNKIILACQVLIFTDSKKNYQISQCGILIAQHVGYWLELKKSNNKKKEKENGNNQ